VVLSLTKGLGTGRHHHAAKAIWLDYDPVALAVLVIGMGMIALLAMLALLM
jgi:threonine dehydrogenase-like Zn-dependent dehydrogenase